MKSTVLLIFLVFSAFFELMVFANEASSIKNGIAVCKPVEGAQQEIWNVSIRDVGPKTNITPLVRIATQYEALRIRSIDHFSLDSNGEAGGYFFLELRLSLDILATAEDHSEIKAEMINAISQLPNVTLECGGEYGSTGGVIGFTGGHGQTGNVDEL